MTSFWQRLRDEAEQRWYVPARTAEIFFLVPLAGSLLLLATAPSRALFVGITHEDGVLEWAEVAAWLLVIPFALAMFWHLWHDDGRRWLAMPYLLLALGAIFVMGEVGAAGQYSYVPGLTVQKAIAIAGGFTPRANQESVDITRDINGKVMTGRVVTSDPLLPGDTVYVRERLF